MVSPAGRSYLLSLTCDQCGADAFNSAYLAKDSGSARCPDCAAKHNWTAAPRIAFRFDHIRSVQQLEDEIKGYMKAQLAGQLQ